jgi:sulfur-oxidizing protein SoxY
MSGSTRRIFILRTGQLGLGLALGAQTAWATPDMMRQLVDEITRGKLMTKGKVTLDLPPLVDNGNTVPMTVSVESPMTDDNFVKVIHVVNEKNPQPDVITCTMGPRCGRASFATRIKLADSQKITAIAEMSDGSFWFDDTDVIVTLAACLEDIL